MINLDDYSNKSNMEEWYYNNPLGTIDDAEVTAEERRHCHLLSLDALTAAEQMELDALCNKFVTNLNDQVEAITF
jgi:hypothetical protein